MSMFHGLSAFPLTPLDASGGIDTRTLGRILEEIVAAGPASIGLLGSTGGYAYLSSEQRRNVLRVAVEVVAGRVPLLVGVGAIRTEEAVALAGDAKAAGADGLLLAPVSYLPLTDQEVFEHVKAVAETGRLPLCIYNNPTTTRFTFGEDLIGRLAALPHVAAVKMPLPADRDIAGELARLRACGNHGLAIGYSGDWGCAEALLDGADAWFSVAAGLLPAPAVALTRAAQAGNRSEVRRIDAAFHRLWALFQTHGSFRVMHSLAGLCGFGVLVPPRPILPLPASVEDEIRGALTDLLAAGFRDASQSRIR